MAANLTPQYLRAEENYRRSATPEEELKWLQVMFAEIPKHKASEMMQMMLKTKISDVKKEIEAAYPDYNLFIALDVDLTD